MHAQRQERILDLFEAARGVPPEKRAVFLVEACPEDTELRAEVESLLAQDAGSFLESAPALPSLSAGMKLGVYELRTSIGRGGMGEVWRAHDPRLQRDVAVKILPPVFAGDLVRVARFEREARAAGALNHPNIVGVYDIGRSGDISWIATELVDGEPLNQIIGRGAVSARKAADFGFQIANGLAAAHEAGIIHRDLKPGNIMISREGRVKIVDFGLAKRRPPNSGSVTATAELTDTHAVMGTAAYMCPEQVRGEDTSACSDIFSLGLILHELLAGKRAFTGDSSIQIMNSILTQDPPELPRTVPSALAHIVSHCLEKEPARRFQCAADLSFALLSAPHVTGNLSAPKEASSLRLGIGIAALVVAAVGAAFWWGSQTRHIGIAPGTLLRRLTDDGGLTTDATLSSDGKLIVYASDRGSSTHLDIWVQPIAGGAPLRLTDDPGDNYDPSVSPDGSQVAFRSDRNRAGIYVVPVLGGDARLLIPNGHRPRYSPDGKRLMYSVRNGDGYSDLFVQPLSGGSPLHIGDGCLAFPGTPVWSPDSGRILFSGGCAGTPQESVFVFTAEGHRVGRLPLAEYVIDQWLAKPSRLLIPFFRPDRSDEASIETLPISSDGTRVTGPAERLTFGTGTEQRAYMAGGRIAISAVRQERHIWGLPVDDSGHPKSAPKQLTMGEGEVLGYLSRDGRKLTFTSERSDHLYYKDLPSGKVTDLPFDGAKVPYSVLSPEGSEVIFTNYLNYRSGGGFIFREYVSSGFPKKIWGSPPGGYGVWDWSPDGSTLLFFEFAGGVQELDLQTQSTTKFLHDPDLVTWQAHFSPDGRWVTFNGVKQGRSRIFVAPFRKELVPRSEWIPIADDGDKPYFSANGKQIFFGSERDGFWCLWAQALTPTMHPIGAPFAVVHAHERRTSFRNMRLGGGRSISAGPNMLVFEQMELTGNIWMLEQAK